MTSQTHNGTFGADYMARYAKIAPSAHTISALPSLRSKRHSIEDARKAVADKLRANLAYLRDPANNKRPDLVYKQPTPGVYAVGIKYGNRWLDGVFKGGKYMHNATLAQLYELLEAFAEDALAGAFDAYIEPIRQANVAAKNGGLQ
jgi:hypothetical protein